MNVKKDNPRTLTVLKMARDLGRGERLTIKQMSERYSIHERTVYRYLKYLEDAELLVDQDFNKRYFIHQE